MAAAAAAVSTSTGSGGCLWTRRQLKRGFWMGKSTRCGWGPFAASGEAAVRFAALARAGERRGGCCACSDGPGRGRRLLLLVQDRRKERRWRCVGRNEGSGAGEEEDGEDEEEEVVERALHMDGRIPKTSDGFLKQVSSSAYDLRRKLEQSMEASSYDVLEANPWRETPKPVYVLAQEENRLLTMRTRRARSEVERELGLLFPNREAGRGGGGRRSSSPPPPPPSPPPPRSGPPRMLVEDVREGVLVFEDEEDATQYCSLLDGQGKDCAGVAELDASDVFAVCQRTQRLAVLFRRGTTPPKPDRLQLNLKARKRSLEDQT